MNIQTTNNVQSNLVTVEDLKSVRDMVAKGATDPELQYFSLYCNKVGLDPIQKQVHFVKRRNKDGSAAITFQTGIDGFRLIAERSGAYAGSDDYLFNDSKPEYEIRKEGKNQPVTATSTVYKIVQGVRVSFTATAAWSEYFPGGTQAFMWNKMPFNQLGKCAEAKALRKAFPNLGGLYLDDEMHQADAKNDGKPVVDAKTPINPKLKENTPLTKVEEVEESEVGNKITIEQAIEAVSTAKDLKELKKLWDLNEDFQEKKSFVDAVNNRKKLITLEDEKNEAIEGEIVEKKIEEAFTEIDKATTNEELNKIKSKYMLFTGNVQFNSKLTHKRIQLRSKP